MKCASCPWSTLLFPSPTARFCSFSHYHVDPTRQLRLPPLTPALSSSSSLPLLSAPLPASLAPGPRLCSSTPAYAAAAGPALRRLGPHSLLQHPRPAPARACCCSRIRASLARARGAQPSRVLDVCGVEDWRTRVMEIGESFPRAELVPRMHELLDCCVELVAAYPSRPPISTSDEAAAAGRSTAPPQRAPLTKGMKRMGMSGWRAWWQQRRRRPWGQLRAGRSRRGSCSP